ncbi:MAG: EamA family transporter [Candidatus Eremiobacteraeota bacterium]|nr:EamA family transporter [Candidatus Eremiobacteraeota bacterium]
MFHALTCSWARFVASPIAVVVAYATTVLIWGTTWLGIKVSLASIPPIAGAGFRFILASLVLYVMGAVFRVDFRRNQPPWHLIAVLALSMFGINYALTYLAETHLASGLVAVLFGTMPFFIFGFARVLVREPVSRNTLIGAVLALGGVAVISLVGDMRAELMYVVAALIASASSGFANVYLKRFASSEPLATLPPAMLIAGVGLTIGGLVFEHVDPARATSSGSLAAVAYLAVFGSALAFYLNHWLLQRVSAGIMGLSALMIPVIAVAVGALAGGEVFGIRDLAGAALVVGGVWLSLAAPQVKRQRRKATVSAIIAARAAAGD